MKESLISCVVPVYNGERYLGETLDSILAQTYQSLEIIVVDDGSTDGTTTVAASYGQRVHYFWHANQGTAAARNLGLNATEDEFVAFLDADDLWRPEKSSFGKSSGSTNDLKSTFVSLVATFGAHLRARKSTSLRDAII